MNNIDRIKQMDADELATCLMCPYELLDAATMPCIEKGNVGHTTQAFCKSCVKEWLMKEANNDTGRP